MKSWLKPKWRMAFFLIGANLLWMTAAWTWTEREAWMWITPIALSINFLLLTYDQVLNFSALESRPLVGHDSWGVIRTLKALSAESGLPEPKVFLIEHSAAQVFSYARTSREPRLYVTSGALELLTAGELHAVLTHQMVAFSRTLPVLNYWMGAVLDLFYRLGRGAEKSFAFIFGWAPGIAGWVVQPAMWMLKFLLISSKDMQTVDRETARRLNRPEDLARALWKMQAYAQTRPWPKPWIFAHMCFVSPLEWKTLSAWMQAQPPVKNRIQNLLGRYPL